MNLEQLERRRRMTQESSLPYFRKGHFAPSYGKDQMLRCTFKQPGMRKSSHPFSLHLPQLWGRAHNSRCIKLGRWSTARPTAPSPKVPTEGVRKLISTVSNHRVGSRGLGNPALSAEAQLGVKSPSRRLPAPREFSRLSGFEL